MASVGITSYSVMKFKACSTMLHNGTFMPVIAYHPKKIKTMTEAVLSPGELVLFCI
jgi:aromatic ring-opening dioxygenase LigB subunit